MNNDIAGIHHVTALASDPQRNVVFYAGVLGLRLVKRTVNFDDPGTYHLYYGDEQGTPGTILTFFPWPGARRGRQGTGQATACAFSIPEAALGYWLERFVKQNIEFEKPVRRFNEQVVLFRDPDGLMLELVAHEGAEQQHTGWQRGTVPGEFAIRGIHTVTLCVEAVEHTAKLLTETMRFRFVAEEGNMFRYATGTGESSAIIDLRCAPDFWTGAIAAGTFHHVAWRAADDADQLGWRATIAASALNVTPVLDRQYFHSIYFREPGGVLFEIATDPPGFTADEPLEQLGTHLKLPPWLEPSREQLEAQLPVLHLPQTNAAVK